MTFSVRDKIEKFVRQQTAHDCARLLGERDEMIDKISTKLTQSSPGRCIDPNDRRLDSPKFDFFEAEFRSHLNAYFSAYELYDLEIDGYILSALHRKKDSLLAFLKSTLPRQAEELAHRTGMNPEPSVAMAVSLSQRLTRHLHTFMGSIACDIEIETERRRMKALAASNEQRQSSQIDKAIKKKRRKIAKRDAVIYTAILQGLKGRQYCRFLKDNGVQMRQAEEGERDYVAAYIKSETLRKKIQDEKTRAKQRMNLISRPQLAESIASLGNEHLDSIQAQLATHGTR